MLLQSTASLSRGERTFVVANASAHQQPRLNVIVTPPSLMLARRACARNVNVFDSSLLFKHRPRCRIIVAA
jgi:hypothetical protein